MCLAFIESECCVCASIERRSLGLGYWRQCHHYIYVIICCCCSSAGHLRHIGDVFDRLAGDGQGTSFNAWGCVMVGALNTLLKRSPVPVPVVLLSGDNLGQIVHTRARASVASSI